MRPQHYHAHMRERMSRRVITVPERIDFSPWLRKALAHRTKGELIDALVEFAGSDPAVLRRMAAHFELQMPLKELLAATRQAVADATAFDERDANYNFNYDYEAYSTVQRNLRLLIERGELRAAMELSLELMDHGSYQVEASDEGLMTEDIEACLKPVIEALQKCDLPAVEMIAWCVAMLKRDRGGFICEQELQALREQFETRPSA